MSLKPFCNICSDFSFFTLLAFLAAIPFSIAVCYLLFTILVLLWLADLAKHPQMPELPPYAVFFAAFILLTLVSSAFSINPAVSFIDNKELLIFLLIPIYQKVLNSPERLRMSLFTVLFSAVASSLIGIFGALRQGISLDHRLRGLTSHWMTYSGLLMMVFIFFFIWALYQKKKDRLVVFLSLTVILGAILFSLTRSMWVGIAAAVCIYVIYRKPVIIIPGLIFLAAGFYILPDSVSTRITSIFDLANETNQDRIFMFHTGIQIFKDYPVTGVGPNNVGAVYHTYRHPKASQDNPHLHNNFLQILAERGIFACLCLFLAFLSIFISLIQKIRVSTPEIKAVILASLFMFTGFVTAGMFEYNWGDSEVKFLLFFFISIPFLHERTPRKIMSDKSEK